MSLKNSDTFGKFGQVQSEDGPLRPCMRTECNNAMYMYSVVALTPEEM